MPVTAVAQSLANIAEKVERGVRLDFDDGVRLYESGDIHTVGALADVVRRRLHGRRAYYNINRHVNYSNYCVLRCKFCSFYLPYEKSAPRDGEGPLVVQERPTAGPAVDSRDAVRRVEDGSLHAPSSVAFRVAARKKSAPIRGIEPAATLVAKRSGRTPLPLFDTETADGPDPGHHAGYELTVDEMVARAKEADERGATEIHIVGGLHPKLPFSYYTDMCRAIRDACPRMHIKAFTAIEIIHFSRIARPRMSIREVLIALREAGLGSMPGGGAEIFDDRVHDEAFKNKVGEAEWFEVHRTAHELGIFTNATMLYGHVETRAERVGHLIKLRAHQDESLASRAAHFNCVIPLSFVPDGSELAHLPGPTGLEDLKTLAISRLMLDNVPHVKAFWIMQTPKLAQVSLSWGVDDIDGTVVYYDITKREGGGGTTHQEMSVDDLKRLIREAGCEPVERDTLYRRVIRDNGDWRVQS